MLQQGFRPLYRETNRPCPESAIFSLSLFHTHTRNIPTITPTQCVWTCVQIGKGSGKHTGAVTRVCKSIFYWHTIRTLGTLRLKKGFRHVKWNNETPEGSVNETLQPLSPSQTSKMAVTRTAHFTMQKLNHLTTPNTVSGI